MPRAIDSLISHPALSAQYGASAGSVTQRLIQRFEKGGGDAVKLNLSGTRLGIAENAWAREQTSGYPLVQSKGEAKRQQIIEAYRRSHASADTPPEVTAVRKAPQDSNRPRAVGRWGNGELKTNTGITGSYEAMPESGQIKFTLGPLKGYVLPNSTGVALNTETGDSYRFDLRVGDGTFAMHNVEKLPRAAALDKLEQAKWEGKIQGRTAHFENMTLEMLDEGNVKLTIPTGNKSSDIELPADLAKQTVAEGFIDKNGNLVLAAEGGTFRADYSIQDGKFKIHGFELLG